MTIRYDNLPEHMQRAARLYIEEGELPGDFLMAVLCNNLVEAFGKADEINRSCLWEWALWLYNEAPMPAWGSEEKVLAWSNEQRSLARARQGAPS